MSDIPPFTQPRLRFEQPPEERQLQTLLADRIVRSPELLEGDDRLEVIPPPRSIWLLLPAVVVAGLLLSVTPGLVALLGWPLMEPGRWGSMVLLLWLVVMPSVVLGGAFLLSLLPAQRRLVWIDREEQRLVLGSTGEEFSEGELVELVELSRWEQLGGKRRQFLQWSVLVRDETDHFTLVPLLTIVDPTADDARTVRRMCEALPCGVTRIEG